MGLNLKPERMCAQRQKIPGWFWGYLEMHVLSHKVLDSYGALG